MRLPGRERPGERDPAAATGPGGPTDPAQVTELVRRLSGPADEDLEAGSGRRAKVRQIAALAAALGRSAYSAGTRAVLGGRWLTDLVEQIAPHVTIRDLAALEAAYSCEGDALAEAVIRSASHSTAALGAAAGALAATELVAPPTLLATPVQLAAETLSVIAVELRMLGELHEVYGLTLTGSPRTRATVLLTSWIRSRAFEPGAGVLLLGAAARRELRKRVMRRLGESMTTLAPFLAGAVAGAEINRRETRKLGDSVAKDLRVRAQWASRAFPPDRIVEGNLRPPRDGSPA